MKKINKLYSNPTLGLHVSDLGDTFTDWHSLVTWNIFGVKVYRSNNSTKLQLTEVYQELKIEHVVRCS